jgi:[histone H3]-trimethyl-L-lysine4 demethylase
MEGETRSTMSYLDKLAKFHRQQGTTLTRPPTLDKQPIDLYQLKRLVDARGGFKDVCSNKKWAEVGRELGYGSTKNITSVSTVLKNTFQKYLLPYETYLEKAKPEFLREMGITPSPQQDRKIESKATSPLKFHRNLMNQIQEMGDHVTDERMDDGDDEFIEVKSESPVGTPSPPQNGLKRSFDETTARSASISTETDKEAGPARRESKRLKKGLIWL